MVDSFSRPGGNATGMYVLVNALVAKQLEVLREVVPGATTVAFIDNPTNPFSELRLREIQEAALALGVKLKLIRVSREHEQRASAVLIAPDPFLISRSEQLAELTVRHAVPTIFQFREFVAAGGLISYGGSLTDAYRQAGIYAGRILKGEKPADLPVQQSAKVELMINLKTAKALGLIVPPTLLARADEVIE